MINTVKINDELYIELNKKNNETIISIINNNLKIVLSKMKTDCTFSTNFVYDKNYIVIYSKGSSINNIPLNIEVVYDIKRNITINLSDNKIKNIFKNILIYKRGFNLVDILSSLNTFYIDTDDDDDVHNNFRTYITSNNKNISDEEFINYVISNYPKLKKYIGLGVIPYSIYSKIEDDFGTDTLWFNIMPQDVLLIGNDIVKRKK